MERVNASPTVRMLALAGGVVTLAAFAPLRTSAVGTPTAGEPAKPRIVDDRIPYGEARRDQMAAYSKRHYGHREWRLRRKRVIVLHFTATSSYGPAWSTFAANEPSLGELPGVCAHYLIGKRGGIHQLVPLRIRCRHTIGLNHLAIGIEMVQETGPGSHWADQQILHRRRQIRAALRLAAWLKTRYGIEMRDVIGHAMANDSPHFTDLEGWRNDHTDWLRRDVRTFRQRLRRFL